MKSPGFGRVNLHCTSYGGRAEYARSNAYSFLSSFFGSAFFFGWNFFIMPSTSLMNSSRSIFSGKALASTPATCRVAGLAESFDARNQMGRHTAKVNFKAGKVRTTASCL